MDIIEQLTYLTIQIVCHNTDGTMSSGSGFVLNVSHLKDITVPILITNHHVVEKAAATCCRFSESDEAANPIDTKTVKFTMPIDAWFHHPDKDIDIRMSA